MNDNIHVYELACFRRWPKLEATTSQFLNSTVFIPHDASFEFMEIVSSQLTYKIGRNTFILLSWNDWRSVIYRMSKTKLIELNLRDSDDQGS